MSLPAPTLTIVIPTYNPRMDHFERVLASLRAQTQATDSWDLLVVDNNSTEPLADRIDLSWHPRGRVLVEKTQGKMHAISLAFRSTATELVMFLDDDTVAKADLIEQTLTIAAQFPMLGTWSPRVELELENASEPPPARLRPYLSERLVEKAAWSNDPNHVASTPWGGGMCLRRAVADAYLAQTDDNPLRLQLDPMGDQPGYGGDSDLGFTGLSIGLGMGVFPQLVITHLIPARRSTTDYLIRNLEAHEFSHLMQYYAHTGTAPTPPTIRSRVSRAIKWLTGDGLARQIIAAENRSRAAARKTIATGRDGRPVTHR